MIIRIVILLFCAHLSCSAAPDFTRFAFTLEVKEGSETYQSGTGCIVKSGSAFYYVTAHHIFPDVTDAQMAEMVKRISIVSELNGQIRFSPGAFIPVPNAKDLTKTDLLVFKMKPNLRLAACSVSLASISPLRDEVVFLSSSIPSHPAATYPLKVLAASDDLVEYEKIPGVDKYTGASGGPVFNVSGQLVGTYLGRFMKKSNQSDIRCLFGTPLASLVTILVPGK